MLLYFVLTYALAWAIWFVALVVIPSPASEGASWIAALRGPVFLIGVFAPAIVAIAMTAREGGRDAVRALVARVFRWEVRARWYIFAVAFMATVKLSAAVVYRVYVGEWPRFGDTPIALMLGALLISTWVQAGEEIGWRGYALPRLGARIGLPLATVVLGVVWAAWHLPHFFVPGASTYRQSFPLYTLQVTALSVIMGWLYLRTGGSLLLVMLFHAAVNNTKDIVPSASPTGSSAFTFDATFIGWTTVVLLWVVALVLLLRMRRMDRGLLTELLHRGGGPDDRRLEGRNHGRLSTESPE